MDIPYKLYKGDCLEIIPMLEAGSVDAIITDLPYGTTSCEWDSIIPLAPMWEQVKRVLKPSGVFITTASQPFTTALIYSNIEWFKYELIWRKTRATGHIMAKNKPMKEHENICVFSQGVTLHEGQSELRITYNPQGLKYSGKNSYRPSRETKGSDVVAGWRPSNKNTLFQEFTDYPKSILEISSEHNVGAYHPTQKPVALYEYLINTYTNFGETVLDICMGSGTTIEAAIKTGRKSIGIERDPKYFAIAEKRISQAAQQPALFHEAQQSVQRTGGESAANLSLFPAEANPPAKVTRQTTRR